MDGLPFTNTNRRWITISVSTTPLRIKRRVDMAAIQSIQIRCLFESNDPICKTHDWQTRKLQTKCQTSTRCGELSTALRVLDEIPHSDTFTWNHLIQTHITNGDWNLAIMIYNQMLLRGVRPDKHTLPRILTASRLSGNLFYGQQIHGHTLKFGFGSDQYVITALMELYGHFDGAEVAKRVFDQSPRWNSVSWTLLVRLYASQDKPNLAIETFNQMVKLGSDVDAVALATALGACGRLKSLQQGRKVHEMARKFGLELDVLVGNSLLKMYLDCGSITNARMVFDQMPTKDVISWTAIIHWYARNGEFNEAMKLFRVMYSEGIKPDPVLISGVLPACARVAAGKQGKEIHAHAIRTDQIDSVQVVQNALMDMYIKSGCLELASRIFMQMKERDIISWTVMMLGCSLHGQGELGVELFRKMRRNNTELDDTLYDAVLHSCTTSCLVEEGTYYFKCIREPTVEQYSLMVSLLARAGLFDGAKAFILEHHLERNVRTQKALLDGCRVHKYWRMGKQIAEHLTELEPLNPDNYVLLSNLYASYGKWDIAKRFREMVWDMGLRPKRAYSWIEVRNKVHAFEVGDVSHPRSERIYHELQSLMEKMKEENHILDIDFSLHDVDEERECILVGHSELLALSFGLISTQQGATIRITKNLRMCRSCHSSARAISKIVNREIVLKDPDRFHHFKDGTCSCRDLW